MKRVIPSTLVLTALASGAAAQSNLVANGSFELGPTIPASGYLPLNPGSTAIDDWVVTRGQIDLVDGTAFLSSSDGVRFLDLHGTPGSGGVLQSLSTVPGQRYLVSFDLSRNWAAGGAAPVVTARVDVGPGVAAYDATTLAGTNQWRRHAFEFVAVAGTTTIELYSLEPSSLGGPLIDDVRVERSISTPGCAAVMNSAGLGGSMFATGSATVTDLDVTLTATGLPYNVFGYFLISPIAGNTPMPGGSAGTLCLGPPIGRYVGPGQVQSSGETGSFCLETLPSSLPQPTGSVPAVPGQTWHYQLWYRDSTPMGNSNFSQSIEVTWF